MIRSAFFHERKGIGMKTGFVFKLKKLFGKTDLTHGCIWKTILHFAFPIMISYFLQMGYSIADTAICGHTLSANEVAGVGDTNPVSFIFLQFAFGCTAGMSVILANRVGKNDTEGARRAFATQIILSFAIVLVVSGVSLLCIKPLLHLIGITPSGGEVNSRVYKAAFTYLAIICGGMIGQFFYNSICCILRSIGDSLTPLLFLFLSATLNIVLDLLFILGCGWGVAGAAAATVLSQAFSAIALFAFTFVKYKDLRPRLADFKAVKAKEAGKMLLQGVPLGLQFSVLAFGIVTMQNGIVSFDKMPSGNMVAGTPAQIGYGAATHLRNLFVTPINALGTAMISFCGQNDGAGETDRIKKGVKQALVLMLIVYAIDLLLGWVLTLGGAYQYVYLAREKITPDTIRYGNLHLYTVMPLLFLVGTIHILRNAVQGLEKPLLPMLAGFAELVARVLVCLFLPRLVNGGPIDCNASNAAFCCLSLADPCAWFAADILLFIAAAKYIFKRKSSAPIAETKNAECAATEPTEPKQKATEAVKTEEPTQDQTDNMPKTEKTE